VLVPFDATSDAVTAYLRRDGSRAVLVIANLGSTSLSGITLSSSERILPAGRYRARSLLGGPPAAAFRLEADGMLRAYLPLDTLAPRQSYLFEIVRVGR
jgi:hypothetical protein